MKRSLILTMAVLMVFVAVAAAAMPQTMSYQGVLRGDDGSVVVDGDYELEFVICTDPIGAVPLWEETQTVPVADGIFNVVLGSVTPIDLDFDVPYWLGISVEGEELSPRVELTSAPYAFRAAYAESAPGIGGLTLPYGGNVESNDTPAFQVRNDGTNGAGFFYVNNPASPSSALAARTTGTGSAVFGGVWSGTGTPGSFWNYDADNNSSALIAGTYGDGPAINAFANGNGLAGQFNGTIYVSEQVETNSIQLLDSPTAGYVLTSDANGVGTWQEVGGGFTLPYSGMASSTGPAFAVGNSGGGSAAHFSGDVGIGEDYPLAKLHVEEIGDDDPLRVRVSGTTRLMVKNDGNVGIGIITPQNKLDVEGGAVIGSIYSGSHVAPIDGLLVYGDVGIGTASPSSKLSVSGGSGSVDLLIEADTDNIGEDDHPSLTLSQDGGTVTGQVGFFNDFDSATNDLALVNRFADGEVILAAGNAEAIRIKTDGDVGIGVTNPGSHRLYVDSDASGASGSTVYIKNDHASGLGLVVDVTSDDLAMLCSQHGDGDILRCDSYTGGWHSVFKVENDGRVVCSVVEITGGSDLAEPFEVAGGTDIAPGTVVCIDPANPGQLKRSTKPYDRTVAGIVSGGNGVNTGIMMSQTGSKADGSHPVALTGRVYCYVDASYGAIEPGDLLTTSRTAGHAMKASDSSRSHGAIIGKAMTALSSGRGLILVLVTLQ